MEIAAAAFEVYVTSSYFQDITTKQFQQQLVILPYKQTLLRNKYGKKIFYVISKWLATCARKPKVLDSSLAASCVHR